MSGKSINKGNIIKNQIYEVLITDVNNLGNGVGRIFVPSPDEETGMSCTAKTDGANDVAKTYVADHVAKSDVASSANGGGEFGRVESGKVVFVPGTVTGDLVRAKIILIKPDFLVARCEEIIKYSPYRAYIPGEKNADIKSSGEQADDAEICAYADKCGGCVYQNLSYDYELELKQKYVKNAFVKAGLPDVSVEKVLSAGAFRYRNKVQYPFGLDDNATNEKNAEAVAKITVGYFARKSHRIIPISDCPLQAPEFTPVIKFILDFLNTPENRLKYTVYDEKTGYGLLRHLCLRRAPGSGEMMVVFVLNGNSMPLSNELSALLHERFSDIVTVILNENRENTNVIYGSKFVPVYGDGSITDHFEGLTYKISAPSFYQVNTEGAKLLYRLALEAAEIKPGDTVCDLFCGVGTIGLYLLKHSCTEKNGKEKLIGVEVVQEAVENAKENALLSGITNASFICGDANSPEIEGADVIVIDPPRKGCEKELVKRICDLAPRRIVYVSCDPDTLARDAALFAGFGFTVSYAKPVDMFPRTGHVETVVQLVCVF